MKLLLDQNLSYKLVAKVERHFPDTTQARLLGMAQATDTIIWQYAADNGFTIVTKDSDFYDRGLIHDFPPKVIWLQCGNTSTEFVASLLVAHQSAIKDFIQDADYACLELY
ncbi:MAG: DUF5615 family PIN-like protein [Burkholderiales bacterium]|nr:DUF5615 family PIN-like protein [Burkholderiales bacterium]